MRGASALRDALPDEAAPVTLIVVWEPVIASDAGPPSDRVRRRAADPRALHFWDPGLLVSKAAIRTAIAHRASLALGDDLDEDSIAWDVVATFPPGQRWEDAFPRPDWWVAPVVSGEDELRQRLAGASRR